MNKIIGFGHTKLEWGEVSFYVYTTILQVQQKLGHLSVDQFTFTL